LVTVGAEVGDSYQCDTRQDPERHGSFRRAERNVCQLFGGRIRIHRTVAKYLVADWPETIIAPKTFAYFPSSDSVYGTGAGLSIVLWGNGCVRINAGAMQANAIE
jgi:hypothetical protein